MALPDDQVAMMEALPVLDGWVLVLGTLFVWGTFLAYLMTLRRFFLPEAIETDV